MSLSFQFLFWRAYIFNSVFIYLMWPPTIHLYFFVCECIHWEFYYRSTLSADNRLGTSERDEGDRKRCGNGVRNCWCNCWLLVGSYLGFSGLLSGHHGVFFTPLSLALLRSGPNLATYLPFCAFSLRPNLALLCIFEVFYLFSVISPWPYPTEHLASTRLHVRPCCSNSRVCRGQWGRRHHWGEGRRTGGSQRSVWCRMGVHKSQNHLVQGTHHQPVTTMRSKQSCHNRLG